MTMDEHFDDVVGKLFEQAIAPMVANPVLLDGLRTLLKESFYAGATVLMNAGTAQRHSREIEVAAHLYAKRATHLSQTFGPVQ